MTRNQFQQFKFEELIETYSSKSEYYSLSMFDVAILFIKQSDFFECTGDRHREILKNFLVYSGVKDFELGCFIPIFQLQINLLMNLFNACASFLLVTESSNIIIRQYLKKCKYESKKLLTMLNGLTTNSLKNYYFLF